MKFFFNYLKSIFSDRNSLAFARHNRQIWPREAGGNPNAEVLVEETTIASSIIGVSYVANILAGKLNAKIVAYTKKRRLVLPRPIKSMYKSFGGEFLFVQDKLDDVKVDDLFEDIYPSLRSKRDIENICVDGVLIGDLVYDTHLRKNFVPTIDIVSPEFKQGLRDALRLFMYWTMYFQTHTVKAVLVSHCVYAWNAIILRIAVDRKIPVYQVTAQRIYYITDTHNFRAYNDFVDYPERFKQIKLAEREAALALARERLDLRFAGHVGVDMHYSTMSAYTNYDGRERVVSKSDRVKILIATHCFFDSPHPYGINLFPDFYEWMTFLGEMSERTDYDWYIKTHPDFLPGNAEIIDELVRKFPRFRLIDSRTSHHQLIEEGIDVVLTVYGTIGHEYAARGVTVINASTCNPHIAYNFNLHPKTVDEYERILLDLDRCKLSIDLNEVYEYYYCKFLGQFDDWLFDDYQAFIERVGGRSNHVRSVSYLEFMQEFSDAKHKQIIKTANNFIESGEYCISRRHLD